MQSHTRTIELMPAVFRCYKIGKIKLFMFESQKRKVEKATDSTNTRVKSIFYENSLKFICWDLYERRSAF